LVLPGAKRFRGAACTSSRCFARLPAGVADPICHWATAVRTQLCLAIAAMAAHIPAKQWGQSGVVMWLAENLGRQSQEVALPCMLELLTVIPEASPAMQLLQSRCVTLHASSFHSA